MKPSKILARAWTRHVGQSSTDPRVAIAWKAADNEELKGVIVYWTETDFDEIATEIDRLLDTLGWGVGGGGDAPDSPWAEIHARTQEELAQPGIEKLECFRGVQIDKDFDSGQALADAKPGDEFKSPMLFASFSTRVRTALNYANAKLGDDSFGVTVRRIIPRGDIVISYHVDEGMATEREVIAKSDDEAAYEIVQITDRAAAEKCVKGEAAFGTGRDLGRIDLTPYVKDRMVKPDFYKS